MRHLRLGAPRSGWGPRFGQTFHWVQTFDQGELEAFEVEEALRFRDRCGCVGDVRLHDLVVDTPEGAIYACRGCGASWVVGLV